MLALPALWLALRPSAPDSPLQVFQVGAGSTAVQPLPWAFIPSVLVPFYLIVHALLFVQLQQAATPGGGDRLNPRAA